MTNRDTRGVRDEGMENWKLSILVFFANNLPISSVEYCGRSSSHIDWHGTDFSANHDHKKVHPTPAIKIKLAEKGGRLGFKERVVLCIA